MSKQQYKYIGKSIQRSDSQEKAYGEATYTDDLLNGNTLQTAMCISKKAHAIIKKIDKSAALKTPGVHAIITGEDYPFLVGPMLADRPPLAYKKVRYYGEPIAVVIADEAYQAKRAAMLIQIDYEDLPVVLSPKNAASKTAPLIHENLGSYTVMVDSVHAIPQTNIANLTKIRKGNFEKAWTESDVKVEASYHFGPADHVAVETRVAAAEILKDGKINIYTSTQGPFYVQKLLSYFFDIDVGKIKVHTPYVGGAFGGKGSVQLEFIAYLASQAVGGKKVIIKNTREEDMVSSPVHIGLEATVKLAAKKSGKITAAQFEFFYDGGAYSDTGPGMSKAGAADCTGPYRIDNVYTDSYCMYTNKPYATSFRGFGHPEQTFAMERTIDQLAKKLNIDPIELRLINTIKPGDQTPTGVELTASNLGDITSCIKKAKELLIWNKDNIIRNTDDGKIIAKGMSCFWKTSSTPTNATAGVIITFQTDGSVILNCAAVELGQGTKTVLGQILAEKLQMSPNKIHVTIDVNTERNPHQWKTVASSTTMLAGRAVIAAADDVIKQLKRIGAVALQTLPEDLDVGGGVVYVKDKPESFIKLAKLVTGFKYASGHSVGGLVTGRGSYIVKHLSTLNPDTGFGKSGPQWGVGVQAVEIEYDPIRHTYKLLKAMTVLDGGKIINRQAAIGQMKSGMYLGLSWASMEGFVFNEQGIIENGNLRNYNLIRASDAPEYLVDFVETPYIDGPYGARGIGEYGVIGMAAALGNCISNATNTAMNQLPLTPEFIWSQVEGSEKNDRI